MPKLLAAAAALLMITAGQALAQEGDAEEGKSVFRRCQACHAVGEGAENKIGPELNDLFGRQPGTVEGFDYSEAMVAFGDGKVWTAELVGEFLRAPRKMVEGTKMAFPGLRKDKEVADIIAFLAQHDEGGTTVEQ